MNNDSTYINGWNYVYDSTTATNRKNATAYIEGKTFKTIIDYYYLSPNIEAVEIKGIETGFDFSDHQPVRLKIKLMNLKWLTSPLQLRRLWLVPDNFYRMR